MNIDDVLDIKIKFRSAKPKLSDTHKKNITKSLTGMIWVNNGIESKFVKSNNIPEGYKLGRLMTPKLLEHNRHNIKTKVNLQHNKGKIYVTNGIIEKIVEPDQIPEGFIIGRSRKCFEVKRVWITNGIDEHYAIPDLIPSGYWFGRKPCSSQ